MIAYEIRDAAGDLAAIHERHDDPDGSKRFTWRRPGGATGLNGTPIADLPLYGIEQLGAESIVVIVEGEKSRDALAAIGIPAVATVTGASSTPGRTALAEMTGRSVVVWADADDIGLEHMRRTVAGLEKVGVASVAWVDWPGAPPHGDAADFLAAGGTRGDVVALIRDARVLPIMASRAERSAEPIPLRPVPVARVVRLSDVVAERVDWLWPGRIPLGKLTILDGDPGIGKSTITTDLAARVSAGRPMPGETIARPPAGVLLLSAEDGLADTIRPRLDAAGADVSRIVALTAVLHDGAERLPTLPGDLGRIEATIRAHDAVLVVVDVLMAFLDGSVNAHRDQDVRGALAPLAAMAERTGAAIIVLRHLNKSSGGPAVYRGGGSIGIVGAARSALVVGCDPSDEGRMVLAVTKANLAQLAPSLAYRIVDASGVGRIEWEGASSLSASQLLAMPTSAEERTAVDDAKAVLSDILAGGPVAAKDVQREARAAGVSDATLRRARDAAGVTARKVGRPGEAGQRWEWSLPEGAHETPKVLNPTGRASSPLDERLRDDKPDAPHEPTGLRLGMTVADEMAEIFGNGTA